MPELISRRTGPTGWILFSNPPKLNAVTYEMIVALPEAIARFERDPQVKLIAFAGDGDRAFVSGVDILEFEVTRGSASATTTYNRAMEEAYRAVSATRKPTLSCIRGVCFGVGVSLALYSDMRMCADDAEFSQPAAKFGLAISYPSVKRLVDAVGPGCAADLLFTGRRVGAAEALALGLVDRVVPAASLESGFERLALQIAEGAPLSHYASKISIRGALNEADLRDVHAAINACHASSDYAEGRKAFAEKRKPNFKGR